MSGRSWLVNERIDLIAGLRPNLLKLRRYDRPDLAEARDIITFSSDSYGPTLRSRHVW